MVSPPGSSRVVSCRSSLAAAACPRSPAVTCASCRAGENPVAGAVLEDRRRDRFLVVVVGGRARAVDLLRRGQEPDRLEVVRPARTVALGPPGAVAAREHER